MIIIWQLLHVLILWVLEFYPYPELVIYPYLRSLGWLPYAQILDQHFPGIMFFPINLNSLGIIDPQALKLLLVLVVLTQSVLIYKIAKHWLAVALFTFWQPFFEGNQLWIDTFLALFTLPAWLFFSKKKYFWAGLFLGVGVVFKQTLVPLVAFGGVYLLWQYRSRLAPLRSFAIGALLPSLVMLLYMASIGVWQDFWYWTLKFNLTAYAAGGQLAPTLNQWLKLSWPLVVMGLAWWRLPKVRLLIAWGILSIGGGIARFGFIHLQQAVPFFCLVYSALVLATWRQSKILALTLLVPTLLWASWFFSHQTTWGGTHFYTPDDLQVVEAITSRVGPKEHIFLLGVNPHIYQLTDTIPAGNLYVFQFPWFLQVVGERVLAGIKADPPQLIVYDSESNIDGQYLRDYASYLVEYVQNNYQSVETMGSKTIYILGDWRTYRDSRYGYSIAYPKEWFVTPTAKVGYGAAAIITNYDPDIQAGRSLTFTPDTIKIEISQISRPINKSFNSWANDNVQTSLKSSVAKDYGMRLVSQESIVVNGMSGEKYERSYYQQLSSQLVYLDNDLDSAYQFVVYPANSNHAQVFNQMLDTFAKEGK